MQAVIRATKTRFVALLTGGVLAIGLAAAPAASAQQSGLVNIDRVLNNNRVAVTVPINAAANVCGVSVTVLSANLASGPFSCDARGNQEVTVSQP